jgi:hypothetical protein
LEPHQGPWILRGPFSILAPLAASAGQFDLFSERQKYVN